jgi:uncharacterized membrane protein
MRHNTGILFLLIISALVSQILRAETYNFTVSAEVEKSSVVNLPKDKVREYISDLSIYPKFFPDIVSVKPLNNYESEWTYRIDAPLASPYYLTFVLVEKSISPDIMILESKDSVTDLLLCKASFAAAGDNRTTVIINFKISMTRENASDIHFLAGILGEGFISDRMHDKLEDDLETFIQRSTKDMYKKFK